MVEPITPAEVTAKTHIPDFVIACFNHYIKRNFHGRDSVIKQCDIIAALMTWCGKEDGMEEWVKLREANESKAREHIYKCNWLDVEKLFRDAGWTVVFNQPDRGESYEPYFTFVPEKRTGLIMG